VTTAGDELVTEQTPLWTTALNSVVCVSAAEVYVVPVLDRSFHVVNGETELCHLITVPVCPVKVKSPLVLPEHTLPEPVTVPPTEAGLIDTVVEAEVATEQAPLWTTALNWVAWVNAPEVYVVAVLDMSAHVLPPSVELCHLLTVPTFPERVRTPLVLPVQIVAPPVTVPPTDVGLTVTVVESELATTQAPLCTTALKEVV
jgi:hypothetical protein